MDMSTTWGAYPEHRRASCSAASGLCQIAKCLSEKLILLGLDDFEQKLGPVNTEHMIPLASLLTCIHMKSCQARMTVTLDCLHHRPADACKPTSGAACKQSRKSSTAMLDLDVIRLAARTQ